MFTRFNGISDEIKLLGVYTLIDGVVLIIVVVYGLGDIGDMVYPPLRLPFKICLVLFTIFWMLPTPSKPDQKNITTLLDIIKKDNITYQTNAVYESQKEAIEEENNL